MNPGLLNEQVTCYAYTTQADSMGGFRSKESVSFTDWANVKRLGSSKNADDARVLNVARYEITMRSRLDWSGDIDGPDFPSDVFKIEYRGRSLSVDGPAIEGPDRAFVTFQAVERQA
jgi:hypothetical protein